MVILTCKSYFKAMRMLKAGDISPTTARALLSNILRLENPPEWLRKRVIQRMRELEAKAG